MMQDPYMKSEIEKNINDGVSAEGAVSAVCDTFIAMFSGDVYKRQLHTCCTDFQFF